MYIEYLRNKNLTPSSKLVLLTLIEYSNLGHENVYLARQKYTDLLGISPNAITNSFSELEKKGFIKRLKNNSPYDNTANFKVIKEAL